MTGVLMTPWRARFVAWFFVALFIGLFLVALIFGIRVSGSVDLGIDPGDWVFFVCLFGWLVTGCLIVRRQPDNWAGWIICAVALALPVSLAAQNYALYSLMVASEPPPLTGLAGVVGEQGIAPIVLLPLLFLLFPDGRPPSARWRWAVVGLLGGGLLGSAFSLVKPAPLATLQQEYGISYPNPLGIEALGGLADILIGVGGVIALIASLSTVVGLRQRYRQASGELRQQIRWLVFVASVAGVLLALGILGSFVGFALESPGGSQVESFAERVLFVWLFGIIAFTLAIGVPAAYLIAMFRYRLWDLDVVIKKAVVFGILVVLITGTAIAVFLGVGSLLTDLAPDETQAVGILGLVVGLLIWPLRRIAGRIADRLVYGGRSSPYEVLTEFSGRVGQSYSTEDVLPRMAQILEATGASTTRIWLRVGGELRSEAAWPADPKGATAITVHGDAVPPIDGSHVVEVRHQGELLGALTLEMPANDPMNPAKQQLANDLASQAGLVLRNVRLIEELRASRQRIVAAQDERAKQIERNIHDGAQQQLVALAVQLKLARTMVDRDPAKVGSMLEALQDSAADALEDLRDLARGIYPPLLADKGLAAALEARARKSAIPVRIDPDGVGRYRQDVESAVYFSVLEALNNVAKYAEASSATVRLRQDDGSLTFEVVDDGRGFDSAVAGYGTGLQGMADRLDAIGGMLEVRSLPGQGTTVLGLVPSTEVKEGG